MRCPAFIKSIIQAGQRVWLRHELHYWDQTIADEIDRYQHHVDRLRRMNVERGRIQTRLDRIAGWERVKYNHGPTMRQR